MTRNRVGLPLARRAEILLAVPMVFAGSLHFLRGLGVAHIVPPWMPWRSLRTYFTSASLIAAAGLWHPGPGGTSVGELMDTAKDIAVAGGAFLLAVLPLCQPRTAADCNIVEADVSLS